MSRPSFSDFKTKALKDPEVNHLYQEQALAYQLRKQLIAMRKQAGLTQADMAQKLNTQKSNISRLENVNSGTSPKLSTIEEYARAMGYKVKIDFELEVSESAASENKK